MGAMLKIRSAVVEDASCLWSAEVETAKSPGRLLSRPYELRLDAFEAKIRDLGPSGCYVVAVGDNDEILGHALLDPMPLESMRHVYRLTIVVHPGRTGRGVGTALISHLQRWAASHAELKKIELLVRAGNTTAVGLYLRLGFREEGRFRSRVRLSTGELIDDIAMAWFPE
jgi:ribosomal protein S18 acetylase RimI-like enzyme